MSTDRSSDDPNDTSQTSAKSSERRKSKWRPATGKPNVPRVLSGVVAIIMPLLALTMSLFILADTPVKKTPGLDTQLLRDTSRLKEQTAELQQQLETLRSEYEMLATPDTKTDPLKQVAAVKGHVEQLEKRVSEIEIAIIEDPVKALSIPLLRSDLEALSDDYQAARDTASKEIDRIYDQNKWFIGLMFTMVIGIVGLAVSNFVQFGRRDA